MQTQTVLVVDDSAVFLGIVGRALMERDIRALPAVDATRAWSILEAESADLILLDLEMPRLGGIQFLEMLRQLPEWQHVPVVIMTSRADQKTRVRAAQLGATEFVIKTANFLADLIAQVEKHLQKRARHAAIENTQRAARV